MGKFKFTGLGGEELDTNNQPIPATNDEEAWNRILLPRTAFNTKVDYSAPSLKYNFPVHPGENPYEIAAQNQSGWQQAGYGLTKAAVTGLLSATENIGLVVAAPSQMIYNAANGDKGAISGLYDNWLGQFVDNINKSLQEKLPNYYTRAQQEMSVGRELGTVNFWADKFANGAGYWLGAMITPYGLEAGLTRTGIKNLTRDFIAQAAKGEGEAALKGIAQTGNTAEFRNLLKVVGTGAIMSVGESNVEARQDRQQTLDALLKARADGDPKWVNASDREIQDRADAAGNAAYLMNLIVTIPTNIGQFGKFIPGFESLFKNANVNVIKEGVGKYVAKEGSIGLARTTSAVKGFIEEGGQELAQFGIQKGVEDYYVRQLDPGAKADYINVAKAALKEAYNNFDTKEGIENWLIGGIMGGPGALIHNWNAPVHEEQQAKELTQLLTTDVYSKMIDNLDHLYRAKKSEDLANQALKDGDKEVYNTEQFNALKSYVQAVNSRDGVPHLINDLKATKEQSAEEVKTGLKLAEMDDWNESTKNEKLDYLIKQVQDIADTDRQLRAKFPQYSESKDKRKQAVFEAIFDGVTGLKNISEREKTLAKEADDLLLNVPIEFISTEDVLGKGQAFDETAKLKNKIEVLERQAKATENFSPVISEQLAEKAKAFKYLEKERKRLIDQFETATKTPEKIEKKVDDLTSKNEPTPDVTSANPEDYKTEESKDFISRADVDTKFSDEDTPETHLQKLEEGVKHYTNKLRELDALIKKYNPEGLTTPVGEEFQKLKDSGVYQAKLNKLKGELDSIKESATEKSKVSSVVLFNGRRLNQMIHLPKITNLALFNKLTTKELIDGLQLKVVDYPDEGQEVFAVDPFDNRVSNPNVKIVKGLIGTQKGVHIIYNREIIGQLIDPDRYRFKNSKGEFIPFNKSVEHLEMLNPRFVTIEDGNKIPTELGNEYINTYNASIKAFDELKKRIKVTDELNNEDVKSIFFINSSVSMERPANQLKAVDYFKQNSWMSTTDYNGNKQGALVYDKVANKFYVFNGEGFDEINKNENEYYTKRYIIDNPDFDKISTNFIGVISEYQDYTGNTRIATSALNYGKVEDTTPVTESLISAFKSISDKFKELSDEGTLEANKIIGQDTQDWNVFIATDSKVTLNLKVSGKSEGSRVKFPGLSLKIEERNQPSKFISLSDKNSVSAIYVSSGKEGQYLSFRNGSTTTQIKSNEDLKNALNTILEENGEKIQILNFLKKAKTTSNTLEDSLIARESKRTVYFSPQKKYFEESTTEKKSEFKPVSNAFSLVTEAQPVAKKQDDKFTEVKKGTFSLISDANPITIKIEENEQEKEKEGLLQVNPLQEELNKLIEQKEELRKKGATLTKEERQNFFNLGKEISKLQDVLKASTKSKDNSAFKIAEGEAEDLINLKKAVDNLKKILPSEFISEKSLEEVNLNLRNNGVTWGGFINSMVYLSKYAEKGTEYHEAFHAIFRSFLNDIEQLSIYKEAKSKYGKPSAKELNTLKLKSVDYNNLSNQQLEMLWYEEKLADDFKDYSKKGFKGFILRLFNRIANFLKSIAGKESEIQDLFNDIYTAKFKSAELVNNNFSVGKSAFKVLEKEAYQTANGEFVTGYLSPAQNNNALTKIAYLSIKHLKENGVLNDEDIINIAHNLSLDYYNPMVFDDILLDIATKNPNRFNQIEKSINDISGALTNSNNDANIIQAVRDRLNHYIDLRDFEEDSENIEDNMPTEFGIKSHFLIGGIDSASKKMREYLSFIEAGIDEFGFGLEEHQLLEDRFKGFLNPYEVYNNLESTLVNTNRDKMLKKLFYLSEHNSNISKFLNHFAKDVFRDLKLNPDMSPRELLNAPFKTLAKSPTFNMFISNFQKVRQTQVDVIYDSEKQSAKVIRTNAQDVQDSQVAQWLRNYLHIEPSEKRALEIVNRLRNKVIAKDAIYSGNINTVTDDVTSNLKQIGIEVSPLFVKYSLIDNAIKIGSFKEYKNSIKDDTTLKEIEDLEDFYSLYTGISSIDDEFFKGLSYGIKSGNPFKEDESSEGSIGRLKQVALSNSFFDENVGNSTYQNVEGKTIYSNLSPNYFSYEAMLWQDDERRSWIFDSDSEKKFKEALENQGKSIDKYQFSKFYQAVKYNPLLKGLVEIKDKEGDSTGKFEYSKEFSDLVFSQFKSFIHGGLREESELTGTTHADLTKRAKYLTLLSYFSQSEGNNFIEKRVMPNGLIEQGGRLIKNPQLTHSFALFKPIQNEGKSTQYAYILPIQEYFKGDSLTKIGEEVFKNFFLQEYERIGEVQKEINEGTKISVEDYNSGKLRGLSFWTFKELENIDETLYKSLLDDAKNNKPLTDDRLEDVLLAVNKMLNNEYTTFKEDLTYEKILNNDDTSDLIPNFYMKDGKLDESKLKSFFFNDYVNTLSFNNLMFGDMSINFKNPVDFVKRMPGANAAGPSVGVDESRVAVIKDSIVKDEFTNDPKKTDINASDAQSYSHAFYLQRKYLQGLGKKSPITEKIIKKVVRGEKLTEGEVRILTDETSLANPKKLSIFDLFFYGKTSVKFLLRSQTSYIAKSERNKLNNLYDELDKYEDSTKEYRYIIKKIHQLWKPMPGQEFLHNLLNRMELPVSGSTIDIVLRQSAVKTQIVNSTDENAPLRPTIVSDNYIREQVITDGIKNKIIHSTQLIQLITSEQKLDTVIKFLGKDSTIGKAVEAYKEHLSNRIEREYNATKDILFKNGIKSYNELLDVIATNLDESNSDSITKELFSKSVTSDEPQYSLNNPRIEQKFENMYLAFVKNIFSHKVPGLKLSLVSDSGNNVLYDINTGHIITKIEFEKNIDLYTDSKGLRAGFDTRKLKEFEENGIYYAECKVSASIASHFRIKEGDTVNSDLFNLVATRIPTQDKHSMVYLKIVEVLPGETGNELVVPAKFVKLAGFDFDIDAEYTRFKAFIKDKLTGNFHIYGDYLKSESLEEANKLAFKEFTEDTLLRNHKISNDLKKLKQTDADYINSTQAVQVIREELKGLTSDYDSYINEAVTSILDSQLGIEETAQLLEEFFSEEGKALRKGGLIINKADANAKELINSIVTGTFVIQKKNKRLKELVAEKKNVKIEIFHELLIAKENLIKQEEKLIQKVFEVNKLPKNLQEFEDKYSKTVKNNINNVSKGEIASIEPITISEINNLLFDIEKNLIRNIGNKEIADTPASRNLAEDFINFYYKKQDVPATEGLVQYGEEGTQDKFNDPTNVTSVASAYSKATLDDANSIGKANIGIVALNNTSFQSLADAGVESRIDQDKFPKDKLLNNQRINDIISTNVTMATDNAKYQDAAYMGLNTETLGATMYALNTKRSFDYIMLINLQPSVKHIVKGLLNISGDIKVEEEKFVKKVDYLKSKINEINKLYYQTTKTANKESQIESLNTDILSKAVLFSEGKKVENFDGVDFVKVQLLATEEFYDNKKKAEFLRNFTLLTSLIKGTESEWSKVQNIQNAIKNLGLELAEIGNTGSINDFEIRHSIDYEKNKKSEEVYPFDVLPAILGNKFLHTELKAFGAMVRDSKEFFVIQTDVAKEIKDVLVEEFKPGHFDFPENYKKFKNDLLSYLMIKSFKHQTGMTTNFADILSEKNIPTKLVSLYYKLLKDDYWRNNLFVKNVEPAVSKDPAFGDFHIHSLNTNTRVKLNPEYKRTIAENFTELFNGNNDLEGDTVERNKTANEFAVEALRYLISKDAAGFRNQSFIQFIEPHLFRKMNIAMKSVEDSLAKDSNYEKTFGISKKELISEFTELFRRNTNYFYGLPKDKRGLEPSVGHKEISPYAFTVKEWNKLVGLQETEKQQIPGKESNIQINKEEQYTKERYNSALGTAKTFMSNFEQLKVPIKDEFDNEYWNSEGYYMAQRTNNLEDKKKIAILSKQGGQASRNARRQFTLDQNEDNRLQYMINAVRAKFQNNPDLAEKLLSTGTQEIIEKNYWNDTLFGVSDKTLKGANILGKVLMQVREELGGKPVEIQPKSKQLDLFEEKEVSSCTKPI